MFPNRYFGRYFGDRYFPNGSTTPIGTGGDYFGNRYFSQRYFGKTYFGPGTLTPTPPTPPEPSFIPAVGSGGGSTMKLARPAGRFGEDHAVYHGVNVPHETHVEPPEPKPDFERIDLERKRADLGKTFDALSKREQAAEKRAARIAEKALEIAARSAADQVRAEAIAKALADEEEAMMLALAVVIGMTV